jgi:hypothetical protein
VLLALGGAVVAWLFFLRGLPSPYFLSLPIREYSAKQLAPNAFAVQDCDALLQHFPKDHKRAYESQTLDRMRKELAALRSKTDTPAVVHLTALALVHEGDVFVLPGDADVDNPDSWLPLREVLRALHQCPSKHKLLLLDIMKPVASARLGVLVDDVAANIKRLLDKDDDPNLLVLCACDAAQLSHVSEETGLSIFAYYLDQGLRGQADGSGDAGALDGRVSARELAAFVRQRVERWAWRNRLAYQTPVLLGKGADFPLVSYEQTAPEPAPEPAGAKPLPDWLRSGWEFRDKAWSEQSYRLAPLEFRRLSATLLRSEQRWRGGKEEIDLRNELKEETARFQEQLKIATDLSKKKAWSVALAGAAKGDLKMDDKLKDALRVIFEKSSTAGDGKPDDWKAFKKDIGDKFAKTDHLVYVSTLFDAAVNLNSPTPERVLFLCDLLAARADEGRFTETIFLDRLKELSETVAEMDWKWPSVRVRQALRCAADAEATIALVAAEPFALGWIRDLFDSAEEKRREAQKYVFQERPSQWDYADAAFREAETRYRQVRARIQTLQQARREWDRAMTLLPGVTTTLAELRGLDSQEERAWLGALQAANKLALWLAIPNPKAFETDEDPTPRRELQGHLNTLQRLLAERGKRRTAQAESAADFLEIQALLQCTWLTVKEREALRRAGREVGRQLHEKTRALDQAEEKGTRPGESSIPRAEPGAARALALKRARFAIDLAQLTGMKESLALQQEIDKVLSRPDSSWIALGRSLREFWGKQLPREYNAAVNKMTLADRLGRLLPPFEQDRDGTVDPRFWSRNPTLYLHNQHLLRSYEWLGERYQNEGRALPEKTSAKTFYEEAAASYR